MNSDRFNRAGGFGPRVSIRRRRGDSASSSVQAGSSLRPNRAALRAAQGFAPTLPALRSLNTYGEK